MNLIPQDCLKNCASAEALEQVREEELNAAIYGRTTQTQREFHQLQREKKLPIIVLEDFFAERARKELEQEGYQVRVYYHAAFSPGGFPEGVQPPYVQPGVDLCYKPVTDGGAMRMWSLTDQSLQSGLARKGIRLPQYSAEFLSDLRGKGHKIFGMEFLVIEGVKS